MKRRGDRGSWGFPAAALAVVGLAASATGSPVGPARWPARGPFGVFTWSAWFASAVLGVSLLLVATAISLRRGRSAAIGSGSRSRVWLTALSFGLLAGASYAAAAWTDAMVRRPAATLTIALAAWLALRALAARSASPPGDDSGVDV